MTPKCPDCKQDQDECICVDPQERIEELERERDALQADNARLREELVKHVAPYLGHKEVYDEVLASIPAQSLTRLRNRVLDEAINVAWNNEPDCNGPIEMALRKLKEPE